MCLKVAVVTGSNKGIGFAIVRGLCKRFEGIVYLTSRDVKRGQQAVADLQKEGLNPQYHQLDITDTKSVEAFRDYIKEKYGAIDVLVNNAGIGFKYVPLDQVAIQAQQTLLVNYFSTLSTCEILFTILRDGARVVNLSSSAGHLSHIPSKMLRQRLQDPTLSISELSDLMRGYLQLVGLGTDTDWGSPYNFYAVSKVGVTAMTKIQQRLFNHRDIKVNAVHPGYVDTDMTSHKGPLTIEEGAQAPLFLALDAADSLKGEYVWCNKNVVSWEEDKPEERY